MKVELDKIGKGCDVCAVKSAETCPKCERNPGLLQLKDFFKKREIGPPPRVPGGLPGQVPRIPKNNVDTLRDWGLRVPDASQVHPSASDQQEPQG
jgi:hypothetical protein